MALRTHLGTFSSAEAAGFRRKPGTGTPQLPCRVASFIEGDDMSIRRQLLSGLAIGALFPERRSRPDAQEEPRFTPDLEQLRETVADRLSAVAEKLGLTDDQKTKIREAHTAFAERYDAFRRSAASFTSKSSRHSATC